MNPEILNQFAELATQITIQLTPVTELVLAVVRYQNLAYIVGGLIWATLLFFIRNPIINSLSSLMYPESDKIIVKFFVNAILSLFIILILSVNVFNVWNWVGVVKPEIRLVQQIYESLTND
jgi:signal transduction histidine kinase